MDAVDDDENKENSYLSDGADGIGVIPGFGGDNEDAYRNVLSIIVNWIPRGVLIYKCMQDFSEINLFPLRQSGGEFLPSA